MQGKGSTLEACRGFELTGAAGGLQNEGHDGRVLAKNARLVRDAVKL